MSRLYIIIAAVVVVLGIGYWQRDRVCGLGARTLTAMGQRLEEMETKQAQKGRTAQEIKVVVTYDDGYAEQFSVIATPKIAEELAAQASANKLPAEAKAAQ